MIDTVSSAVILNELVFNIFILFKITKINNFHTFFFFSQVFSPGSVSTALYFL